MFWIFLDGCQGSPGLEVARGILRLPAVGNNEPCQDKSPNSATDNWWTQLETKDLTVQMSSFCLGALISIKLCQQCWNCTQIEHVNEHVIRHSNLPNIAVHHFDKLHSQMVRCEKVKKNLTRRRRRRRPAISSDSHSIHPIQQ